MALEGVANATPLALAARYGGKRVMPWGALDLYALDQSLRKLELETQSRSPLRWDPFHYEPMLYEILNTILLAKLCPSTLRWQCSAQSAEAKL